MRTDLLPVQILMCSLLVKYFTHFLFVLINQFQKEKYKLIFVMKWENILFFLKSFFEELFKFYLESQSIF